MVNDVPERKTVQSVQRACRIVELIARSDAGLSLGEISQVLGLQPNPPSSLADTLVEMRFLDRAEHPRRYRLGPALSELLASHRVRERHQRLIGAIRALAKRHTQATVTAFEVRGGEMVMIARIGPPHRNAVEYPESNMPPYTNASSLLLLAALRSEARARYEARYPFDVYGVGYWETRARLEEHLQAIREQGYAAIPRDDTSMGLAVAVAAGVWSAGNQLEAALGFHGPREAGEDEPSATCRITEYLWQAIAEHELGNRSNGEVRHPC